MAKRKKAAALFEAASSTGDWESAATALLTELQSTRQQLTALRDKWRASAESSIRIIAASNMPETFPTARAAAEALRAAADELDSILKGTPSSSRPAHKPQPLTESE